MKTIEEINVSNEIKKALKSMSFTNLTAIQELATPLILEDKDVIALAHTGSGKTVAFGIGAIEKTDVKNNDIQVLILCPTRELAIQTSSVLNELTKYKEGVRILSIFGGQSIDRQIMLLKKKPQIIVSTPGRLLDHMNRRTVKLHNIKMVVLDEADEMLDMGFREDLDKILITAPKLRQTLLFSATMSKDVEKITTKYQNNAIVIRTNNQDDSTPKIKQCYIEVKDSKDKDILLKDLINIKKDTLTIVFCNTKRRVDKLKELLDNEGFGIEALHGDMRQTQRANVMRKFKSRNVNILITTDVAARGIDVNDIETVINYDLPTDSKYYVHRIGRTGRAGKMGESITFVASKERVKLRNIENEIKTKMSLYSLPNENVLLESRLDNILLKAKDYKGNKYTTILNQFIERENIELISVANYFLSLLLNDGETKKNKVSTGDKTRLFISLGKLDKMTGTKLTKWIIDTFKLKDNGVFDVEVFDKFSFFSVSNNEVDKVLNNFNGLTYNKRRVGIEISDKPNTKFKKKKDFTKRKFR